MPTWAILLIQQAWPILWGFLGPLLTGLVETLSNQAGKTVPGVAKVALNYGTAITAATYMSNDTNSLQMSVMGGAIGAMIGNRIREAMKAKPPAV